MHPDSRLRERRRLVLIAATGLSLALLSCSPLPTKFTKQAIPGATLTALVTSPSTFEGKVVILGGVIVEERQVDGRIWLHMKNRPLDRDYEPHRDTSLTSTESGFYWIIVDPEGLPQLYKEWARLTVVGRILTLSSDKVGKSGSERRTESVWEATRDPNYIISSPLQVESER